MLRDVPRPRARSDGGKTVSRLQELPVSALPAGEVQVDVAIRP